MKVLSQLTKNEIVFTNFCTKSKNHLTKYSVKKSHFYHILGTKIKGQKSNLKSKKNFKKVLKSS